MIHQIKITQINFISLKSNYVVSMAWGGCGVRIDNKLQKYLKVECIILIVGNGKLCRGTSVAGVKENPKHVIWFCIGCGQLPFDVNDDPNTWAKGYFVTYTHYP